MKTKRPEFNASVDRSFSRFRIAILSMGMVVLIMALLLIGALQEIADRNGEAVIDDSYAVAKSVEEPEMINLLVAKKTIAAGEELSDQLFTSRPVKKIHAPADAYFESDMPFVVGKFSKREIKAEFPISGDDISETRVVNELDIPDGYRAVTISVNNRTSVEGFAKPNTHVDVLWFHKDERGMQKVATIVRAARILAFGGMTDSEAMTQQNGGAQHAVSSTATLLVEEREAQMVELAGNLGSLSLSLVGAEELQRRRNAEKNGDTPRLQTVSVKDIYRLGMGDEELQEQRDGLMRIRDPRTGKLVKYELVNGKWREVIEKPGAAGNDSEQSLARAALADSAWQPRSLTVNDN